MRFILDTMGMYVKRFDIPTTNVQI